MTLNVVNIQSKKEVKYLKCLCKRTNVYFNFLDILRYLERQRTWTVINTSFDLQVYCINNNSVSYL